jgi:biopolymer transport protein ExbD
MEGKMLGVISTLVALLIAASAMAQSPKVDLPPVSSGSNTPRAAVPAFPALVALTPAPLTDDEQRQEDTRRRALLVLLLNSGSRVHPLGGMSR